MTAARRQLRAAVRIAAAAALVATAGGCGGAGRSTARATGTSAGTSAAAVPTPAAPATDAAPSATTPGAPTSPTTTPASPATTSTRPAAPASGGARSTDCEALGIDRRRQREGPCTHGALAVYVADRGTRVRLREMDITLIGYGVRPAERGMVVAELSLRVANRTRRRAAFDARSDQTVLRIGSREYSEDRRTEDAPGGSFAWLNRGIRPGGSQNGTISFRIPRSQVRRLATVGNLLVVQFSDEGARRPKQRVAILRTYR